MSRPSSPIVKLEAAGSDDSGSDATPNAIEVAKLEATDVPAKDSAEWTFHSSLQVLGGFMLLFNSYNSVSACANSSKMGLFERIWSVSELLQIYFNTG